MVTETIKYQGVILLSFSRASAIIEEVRGEHRRLQSNLIAPRTNAQLLSWSIGAVALLVSLERELTV